jgi:hypothetical protein
MRNTHHSTFTSPWFALVDPSKDTPFIPRGVMDVPVAEPLITEKPTITLEGTTTIGLSDFPRGKGYHRFVTEIARNGGLGLYERNHSRFKAVAGFRPVGASV